MKEIAKTILLDWIVGRFIFLLLTLVGVLFSLGSPLAALYGGMKMVVTGKYWQTSSFRWMASVEDSDICFFNFRIPIRKHK